MPETTTGALSHLRVLDLTTSTLAYAGKLLADLGADVLRIDVRAHTRADASAPAPAGGAAQAEPPPAGPDDGPPDVAGRYLDAGKRSLGLDLGVGADRERFAGLVRLADLVLESLPVGCLDERGVGYDTLAEARPGLVWTSITGFGQTGPRRGYRSNDLVASALGGAMISVGHPEDAPVRLAAHQAHVSTASLAVASSLMALRHRDRTGRGQHIDVSSLETVAAISHIAGVGPYLEDGIVPKRVGNGLVASVPSGAYPCRDGLVYLMVNRPAHWEALATWIHEATGNEEVLDPVFHGPSSSRLPYRELLDVFIGDLTRQLTVDEAYHEGQRRRIAMTPIQSARDVVADRHLRARGFFVDLELGDGRRVEVPGPPYRLSGTPWGGAQREPLPRDAAPDPGAIWTPRSDRAIARDGAAHQSATTPASAEVDAAGGALAGLRVVEFGTGLAWAGAEVIKIESHAHPDVPRLFVSPREPARGTQPQCSPWFTDWSAGKRFAAIDLRNEEGAELARRIVERSDAVIANYSTGVLDKLGLGSETLRARQPRLVMLESNGFGGSGPHARYVTWGPNIEALSGLGRLTGFPHRDCTISHFAYPDPLSALHGLVALLAALAHRERSGEGQAIELAQLETTVAAIGTWIAEAAAGGREPPKRGNGERGCAPHGCFPCRGEDRWCVVCVEDDADWVRLQGVLGRPEWALDPRFERAAARVEHAAELEARLSAWTREREAEVVMEACQRAGLAAGVVQSAADLLTKDPQLAHRRFFEEIPHFVRGTVVASGIPMGLSATPGRTRHAGSAVGHDNAYVFGELLGLSEVEVERLTRVGAIEARRRDTGG